MPQKLSNIASVILPFHIGDFVRIKDKVLVGYKAKENQMYFHHANLCEVMALKDGTVVLKDIDGDVKAEDIEAILIDGVHDKKVFFDPPVAAIGVSMSSGHDYFMHSFETMLDTDGKKYSDLVVEKNFYFVHEVQQWLRERGETGMKIYLLGY